MTKFSLRSGADEEYYQANKSKGKKNLLEEPYEKEWDFWVLIKNDYPYSMVAQAHWMLLPKSGRREFRELHNNELDELYDILGELQDTYSYWGINSIKEQSMPAVMHIHLVKYYDNREDIKL